MVIRSDTYFVSVTTITHSKTTCFALWDYISSTPKINPLHLQVLEADV